jgi:hypothetical protein
MGFVGAKWRLALSRPYFLHSSLLGLVLFFFAISFMLNCARIAETYPVTPRLHDLVLDILPAVDVNALSTYGIELFIWSFYGVTLLFFPERFPFGIKAFAIFKLLRGICLVLTHFGPPFGMIEDGYPGSVFGGLFFTKDLFFSGHTGYPIMAALVYWDIKWLRYIGLAAGLVLGFTTLLMHDHYTIDVVAALMAAPVVYIVSRWLFETDYLAGVDAYRPAAAWEVAKTEQAAEQAAG